MPTQILAPTWRTIGKQVEGMRTTREAIVAAGLNWNVRKEPLCIKNGDGTVIPGFMAVQREDNAAVLGIVKKNYQPIQNVECFNFFDDIIRSGKATFDHAGELNGGKRIWITANIKGEFDVNGDDKIGK